MCSVDQEDFRLDPVKSDVRLNAGCKKCAQKADVVFQKRHSYCRSCSLNLIQHKFRSCLGKTKAIKHDEEILVVSTGDANSVALIHLITQGMLETAHKRIKFKPTILFIDETVLWPPEFRRNETYDGVLKSLACSFDCYVAKLSSIHSRRDIIDLREIKATFFEEKDENDVKLMESFKKMKSATSKIDFILRLRHLIQTSVARKLGAKKIFTPECGSNLAVRLLSDVILGRGSQISSDIGVCDTKLQDIVIMRPLREITTKEVTFYNIFNGLEFQTVPSLTSLFDSGDSIQAVTESFICGLQEEYPSTVYTVFHTGDKLKDSIDHDKEDTCIMCHNKIDLSKCPVPLLPKSTSSTLTNGEKSSCDSCTCRNKDILDVEILRNSLCYGCNRLINDMDNLNVLPSSIVERAKLKSQIEDFLL